MGKKNFIKELIFLLIIILGLFFSNYAVIKSINENSEKEEEFKLNEVINYSEELSLNGYTEFSVNKLEYPDILFEYELYYKSTDTDSKITYNVKNTTYKIGDKINSGDLIGKDDLDNDVFASKDMIVVNRTDSEVICFIGYSSTLYCYLDIMYLSEIQNYKNIRVTSDYETFYDAKIVKIDADEIVNSGVYAEIEVSSFSDLSLSYKNYLVVYNDNLISYGLSNDISTKQLKYGNIIAGYYFDNNDLKKIEIVIGNEKDDNYLVKEIYYIENSQKVYLKIENINNIYIKI